MSHGHRREDRDHEDPDIFDRDFADLRDPQPSTSRTHTNQNPPSQMTSLVNELPGSSIQFEPNAPRILQRVPVHQVPVQQQQQLDPEREDLLTRSMYVMKYVLMPIPSYFFVKSKLLLMRSWAGSKSQIPNKMQELGQLMVSLAILID